ncbi:MAG: S1-like domain-containing RNA-binding protein [Bacteroidia bacterium]|nr:S1-like domain-containing RNA-binding protein [Bacteroidia bacterium]
MIEIGIYQDLLINRSSPVGLFLKAVDGEEEVLLPNKYLLEEMEPGKMVRVFVYRDTQDRKVATTEEPLLILNQFGYLKVAEVNNVGAFLDWGLVEKQLMVPFKNQKNKMQQNKSYLVYLYKDNLSDRLVASSRIDSFLKESPVGVLTRGREVDLIVRGKSDMGVSVIVDQAYKGLIFNNELFRELAFGQEIKGYVKQVREDGKLDISLEPIGVASIEPNADLILSALRKAEGFLPFTDKSDPDAIRQKFGISKKLFKKAIGSLYKQRMIELKSDGIYLSKD